MIGLYNRVAEAIKNDNTICATLDEIKKENKGYTTTYMESLGLSKTDLKKLERKGLALRGYGTREATTPLGKRKSTRVVVWMLVVTQPEVANA
jgi:hypothetical protein